VNEVYLPLTSATQARPIIVCARIAQRSLAVWALAELDIREQELGAGSLVAHALINQRRLAELAGSESGLAPHSLSLRPGHASSHPPSRGLGAVAEQSSLVTRKRPSSADEAGRRYPPSAGS